MDLLSSSIKCLCCRFRHFDLVFAASNQVSQQKFATSGAAVESYNCFFRRLLFQIQNAELRRASLDRSFMNQHRQFIQQSTGIRRPFRYYQSLIIQKVRNSDVRLFPPKISSDEMQHFPSHCGKKLGFIKNGSSQQISLQTLMLLQSGKTTSFSVTSDTSPGGI